MKTATLRAGALVAIAAALGLAAAPGLARGQPDEAPPTAPPDATAEIGPEDGPGVTAIDFEVLRYDFSENAFIETSQFDEGARISASSNAPIWPILVGVRLVMESGHPAFRYPVELVVTTDGEEVFRATRAIYTPHGHDRIYVPFLVDMRVCGSHEFRATWLGDASRAARVRAFTGECGE